MIQLAERKRAARKSNKKEEYQELKREIQRKIRIDKREWLEKECEKLNEYNMQRSQKSYTSR